MSAAAGALLSRSILTHARAKQTPRHTPLSAFTKRAAREEDYSRLLAVKPSDTHHDDQEGGRERKRARPEVEAAQPRERHSLPPSGGGATLQLRFILCTQII